MLFGSREFKHATAIDFEFSAKSGENPEIICLVTRNLETGATLRYWKDELLPMSEPPFPIDQESLVVAYYASAEMNCFLKLNWAYPVNILDLFTEYRCITNNKADKSGLLDALKNYGIDSIGFAEKDEMRQLAIRGAPFTEQEKRDLLEYCESDTIALDRLLKKMLPAVDIPRALLRGRYMGVQNFLDGSHLISTDRSQSIS